MEDGKWWMEGIMVDGGHRLAVRRLRIPIHPSYRLAHPTSIFHLLSSIFHSVANGYTPQVAGLLKLVLDVEVGKDAFARGLAGRVGHGASP
jgi:hypothetical protein